MTNSITIHTEDSSLGNPGLNPMTNSITIHTDGSCLGNPGPGGFAAIIQAGDECIITVSGRDPETTNNRMELMAVIEAMETVNFFDGWKEFPVTLHSDSQYVIKAFNEGWISGWTKKGWRTAKGPVKNIGLWKRLLKLVEGRDMRYVWVKGHSGDPMNEACDRLAVEQAAFACSQTAPWVSTSGPAAAVKAPEGPAETAKACPDFVIGYEACRQELFRFLQNLQPGPPHFGDHFTGFGECRQEVREFLDRMSPGDSLPF